MLTKNTHTIRIRLEGIERMHENGAGYAIATKML